MSATVVDLSEFVARRGGKASAPSHDQVERPVANDSSQDHHPLGSSRLDFCFWQGMSGERYIHHVHSLIGCPQVPAANYILFARNPDGSRKVLHVGHVAHEAPSLNLAEIRHRGAKLGASEVHVHLLAKTEGQRCVIEMDLRAGLGVPEDPHQPLSA